MIIKGSVHQEDTTHTHVIDIDRNKRYNLDPSSIGASKYIKQILIELKGEVDSNTITIENFNTPFQQWIGDPDRK